MNPSHARAVSILCARQADVAADFGAADVADVATRAAELWARRRRSRRSVSCPL